MNNLPATTNIDDTVSKIEKSNSALEQAVSQFAQLLVVFKSEIDMLRADIQIKITVTSAQAKALQAAATERTKELCQLHRLDYQRCGKPLREAIWREFHREFVISSRYDLPASRYNNAMEYINDWSSISIVRRLRAKYGGGGP